MTEAVPWWECRWLHHRHAVEDVHPLLEEVQRQRGTGFMTVEHILAVLDAKDPDALVASWIGGEAISGVPMKRRCRWRGCRKEKVGDGPAAKYCALHADRAKRTARREATRQWRGRKTRPIPAPA